MATRSPFSGAGVPSNCGSTRLTLRNYINPLVSSPESLFPVFAMEGSQVLSRLRKTSTTGSWPLSFVTVGMQMLNSLGAGWPGIMPSTAIARYCSLLKTRPGHIGVACGPQQRPSRRGIIDTRMTRKVRVRRRPRIECLFPEVAVANAIAVRCALVGKQSTICDGAA